MLGWFSSARRAIRRRYQHKSTVVTTNKPFAECGEVFPNAACVVSLIDRLMHRAEVVRIDGKSYRQKEAEEREVARKASPRSRARTLRESATEAVGLKEGFRDTGASKQDRVPKFRAHLQANAAGGHFK